MNNLLLYLGQASACLLAFYGFYHWVLRKETCFQYNRAYLLGTPALSFLLPLVPLPGLPFRHLFSSQPSQAGTVTVETDFSAQGIYVSQQLPAAEPFDWEPVIWTLYGLGFCFFTYQFIRQLLSIRHYILRHQASITCQDGIKLIPTHGQLPTFSFLNYLFWDSSQAISETEKQKILQHEAVHIAQKHTWDVLYLELFCLVFWFHPVLYFYKKALTHTHEFIADAEVIRTTNQQEYATLLVQQVFKQMDLSLGHFFNKSLTLKRMHMLQRNHLRPNRLKQFLALPLIALLFMLVSAENAPATEGTADPQQAIATPPENLIQAKNSKQPGPAQGVSEANAAQFPGGKAALGRYLKKNIKYPAEALKNGITGQAVILVTIDAQGRPGNFKTLQADNPYFEQEALRVLQAMPDWQPAKGNAQPLTLAFPFQFGLNSNKGLPALKVPASNTRFALQEAIVVVGYSRFIGEKTVTQSSGAPKPKPTSGTVYPRDSKVFAFVEQQPVFPGGNVKMNEFIRENLKYPAEARKSGKEGLVVVQFVVDRNGKISDPRIVKPLGAGTDEEALRVVKLFPDFEPAKQNGKPVEFQYTLPIRFGLAPKDPANGYIPPSKANPTGSYLSTQPAASEDCQPGISFMQNEQFIDLHKTRPSGDLKVAIALPGADCPAKNYQVESIRYFLRTNAGRVGDRTVTVNSFNLNELLSLSQPGDVLTIIVQGRSFPGKDGQASSPFGYLKGFTLK